MTEWREEVVGHFREAGVFELRVDGDGPFHASVTIRGCCFSPVLLKVHGMSTVEKAKKAIETRFISMLKAGINAVSKDG